jgi:hypothetical protein
MQEYRRSGRLSNTTIFEVRIPQCLFICWICTRQPKIGGCKTVSTQVRAASRQIIYRMGWWTNPIWRKQSRTNGSTFLNGVYVCTLSTQQRYSLVVVRWWCFLEISRRSMCAASPDPTISLCVCLLIHIYGLHAPKCTLDTQEIRKHCKFAFNFDLHDDAKTINDQPAAGYFPKAPMAPWQRE